jgi:hypothetical protein
VNYPNVKNAHIVPRTYLANWARDGKIATWIVPEGKAIGGKRIADQSIENVGTRYRFYRRKRAGSDEPIDDIEWALGQGESKIAPLLRTFLDRWPLAVEEKANLAEMFAFQLLRGPRWKAAYEAFTKGFIERYDSSAVGGSAAGDADNAVLLSDSHRLVQMFGTATTATSVFAMMHWTLVAFARPVLTTSDQPVVLWPGSSSRRPAPTDVTDKGIFGCSEARLPLSPTHCVLLTWAEKADDEDAISDGVRDHAANINAFTVASADRQWFHVPGRPPPRAEGTLMPLAPQLLPAYSGESIDRSERRRRAMEHAAEDLERDAADRKIYALRVTRDETEPSSDDRRD